MSEHRCPSCDLGHSLHKDEGPSRPANANMIAELRARLAEAERLLRLHYDAHGQECDEIECDLTGETRAFLERKP
jgi:hypothetical protein